MSVKEHYDTLLGGIYSWMIGDFESNAVQQENFFRTRNLTSCGIAFDLGCGNGIQSVALARLGYSVFSFDFNRHLLDELETKKGELDITTIQCDLMNFDAEQSIHPDLIVCMGDTLTHLPDRETIFALLNKCSSALVPGGSLVISFRDMSMALEGDARFIPVKSDDTRIMTCFLEYFDDHVAVHDLVNEKKEGLWVQKVSSYNKVRISENEMKELLAESGFSVISSEIINRMVYITAKKKGAVDL
ncbi:MAG TPA: methyltransferase domain-containing protein [Spirochaetota bacterium]|nr:methyltransferase domain-containing protein [Spirochaetota bacterium]